MAGLVLIGYWRSEDQPDWPDPHDFVDPAWDADERSDVAEYLFAGTSLWAYLGRSRCRFCGQDNGSLEYTDGHFVWPEGLAHYLTAHDVRLPQSVVNAILVRRRELDDAGADRDTDWWRTATLSSTGD